MTRRLTRRPPVLVTRRLLSCVVVLLSLLVVAAAPSSSASVGGGPHHRPETNRRVGYFIQWGIYGRGFLVKNLVDSGAAARLTHINYAFGNVSADGECFIVNQPGEGDAWADFQKGFTDAESVDGVGDTFDQPIRGNFNQLRELKAMFPDLRVNISLGGWTWSRWFSDAARTPESRERFVRSCVDLYLRGNVPELDGDPAGGPGSASGVFDGIDLDWEWPGSAGNPHNVVRPEDRENFTALVREFRRQMDRLSRETGRDYELSAFLPADPAKIDAGFQVRRVLRDLDFATVQGYDLHGAWETTTNHQANLFPARRDPSPVVFSVDSTIRAYLQRGAPAPKLVVGLPFFGRGWAGVPPGPGGDGLFQTATGGAAPGVWEPGANDYEVLAAMPGPRFRDRRTGTLWLYDGSDWWSYDDPETLDQKMSYIRHRGLGGAMAWSLDGDDPEGSLVRAMDDGLGAL